jgi:hypothetical protein
MLRKATESIATTKSPDMRIMRGERCPDIAMTTIIPIEPNMGRIIARAPVSPSERLISGGALSSTTSWGGGVGACRFVVATGNPPHRFVSRCAAIVDPLSDNT